MSIKLLLVLLIFVFLVACGVWRWKVVNRPCLTSEQCEQLYWPVIEELFKFSSDVGDPIRIYRDFWPISDLSVRQWIHLCHYMIIWGYVSVPDDWNVIHILFDCPPEKMALTKKGWELMMNKENRPYISIESIGDVNGPINVGGEQIVIYGQELSGEDLQALVCALRQDARGASEPHASSLREAADAFQNAVEGREPVTSPAVTGALKWVRQCVTDAVGNAVGNAGGQALLNATVAVASALGWV